MRNRTTLDLLISCRSWATGLWPWCEPPAPPVAAAARSLALDKTIGTIAPGFEADIIATDGNPLQDITAVRRVVFVMKGGTVYKNVAGAQKSGTRSSSGE